MGIIFARNVGRGLETKRGVQVIPIGANSVSVDFALPFLNMDYHILVTMENIVDSPVSIYSYIITDRRSTGFTVSFSGDMESDNYKLNWIAQKY
ncbi:hypothetical protein LCGC14_0550430 [marine sediment metagenome]|uniref:Uncharacterized protein n=1 Tax=marine sediment metagenome TaxID=412755 RepID=A0A0F9RV00_9ZZZZ